MIIEKATTDPTQRFQPNPVRTVIPTNRRNDLFSGWGVRF